MMRAKKIALGEMRFVRRARPADLLRRLQLLALD
jgi:hypothetical protein